ncbi:hypothetical protein PHET_04110 [Paragonimus heterotremus]|uniref:Uncharacterized protein n=1 Tax=Paragonimus heterotremus TaxID=100268 RepID=A0A8J4WHM4_9TREM|nr:hypothetical protein PHET_04110 [Paragonimus heterotremus]
MQETKATMETHEQSTVHFKRNYSNLLVCFMPDLCHHLGLSSRTHRRTLELRFDVGPAVTFTIGLLAYFAVLTPTLGKDGPHPNGLPETQVSLLRGGTNVSNRQY